MRSTLGCAIVVGLCMRWASECCANDVQRISEDIRARWPQVGVLRAEYADDFNTHIVAWDFASDSWFMDNGRGIIGGDAFGAYSGDAPGRLERAHKTVHTGFGSVLDAYFPQLFVLGLAKRSDVSMSGVRLPTGGWHIVASLPRGSRNFTVAELIALSPPEVDRWGGVEGIYREVEVILSASLDVESIKVEGEEVVRFDRAADSPPGFQVVGVGSGALKGFQLTRLEFDPNPGLDRLTMASVQADSDKRRGGHPGRTPVRESVEGHVQPARQSTGTARVGSVAWVVSGGLVAAIGVGLVIRKRIVGT